ncbi:hypothetical protein COU74_02325 [Candidatus Peregrinibacteria bacterium CG10_big_fil_rev_8_21_14_0_10_36_19]|nr:MAG: hypothetical protein COU74_02325 [Candidatus Peregrinibacteria bacterium CG10_big_fil_rev_8_21_14_0_10_36_19]
MSTKSNVLSSLFRDIESDIGTREMSLLILRALKDSLKALSVENIDEFLSQMKELAEDVSNTEPKFGVLNYNLSILLGVMEDCMKSKKCDRHKIVKCLINKIDEIVKSCHEEKNNLIANSGQIDVEGKTILMHDHSHTVWDVLCNLKRSGKHFKVVIAEQDFDKTHSNIEKMHAANIPFQVVPSYMLSHIHESIDMAFFGAVTLKDTMHFVMDPGSFSVISEFHVDQVPAYVFIETKKFSFWKSKKRSEIFIHHHKRSHHSQPIEYDRIKYSHDRVPAHFFTKIVTDQGIYTPKTLKDFFDKRLSKLESGAGREN